MRNVMRRIRPSVLIICVMLTTVAIVMGLTGHETAAGVAIGGLIALGKELLERVD